MKRFGFALTLALALAIGPAAPGGAQPRGAGPMLGTRGRPAFMEHLLLPQFIMRYQGEIELSDEQRDAISATIADTQSKIVDLRWQSEAASQKLAKLLAVHPIDETQALTQADEVLRLEEQLKRTNLAMLIAVRNKLTAEQQKTLEGLRPMQRPRRRPAMRRPADAPAPDPARDE